MATLARSRGPLMKHIGRCYVGKDHVAGLSFSVLFCKTYIYNM